MSGLAEFLRARLDDEMRQVDDPHAGVAWPGKDPERVIASTGYWRIVLASHHECDMNCIDIRSLAHRYANHPDYREEWGARST